MLFSTPADDFPFTQINSEEFAELSRLAEVDMIADMLARQRSGEITSEQFLNFIRDNYAH